MKILKVLNNPIFSSIQDTGRFGFENHGVPNSGAGDTLSYRLGNYLLGNDNVSSIEIIYGSLEIEFISDCVIAITGSDMNPKVNSIPVKMWETIQIIKDDILSFSSSNNGLRSYISVKGGFSTNQTMNSSSTHTNFNLGGKKLKINDYLHVDSNIDNSLHKKLRFYPDYYHNDKKFDVIKGPEFENLTDKSKKILLNSSFKLSNRMSRTGIVLDGNKIEFSRGFSDIISDGTYKGVIQVPNDGKLYVLMEDSQRIGGYPRILSFTSYSLSYISQLMPKDEIIFNLISLEEAHEKGKNIEKNFFGNNITEIDDSSVFNLSYNNKEFIVATNKKHKNSVTINGKPIKLEF